VTEENSKESRASEAAVDRLSGQIELLNSNFRAAQLEAAVTERTAKVAQAAADRARNLLRWVVGFSVLSVVIAVGGVITAVTLFGELKSTQRAACEFGNARNDAIKDPWTVLVAQSEAGRKNPTQSEVQAFQNFNAYLDALYAPRDCNNPKAKFEKPPKPDLSGLQK
jgi:hypothetical protein